MNEYSRNHVSRAVWNWGGEGAASDRTAAAGLTRRKAVIQSVVMLAVAVFLFFFEVHHLAAVVGGVAVVLLVLGLAVPPAFRAVERFFKAFGRGVGIVLTWLLLVPFFYLVFGTGHFLLRLRGKDPLHRDFAGSAATAWWPYESREGIDHYRKQYK